MVHAMSLYVFLFCFKKKTAYEMRISDGISDVCSSDLSRARVREKREAPAPKGARQAAPQPDRAHTSSGEFYAQQITLTAFGRLAAQFNHRAFLGQIGRASGRDRVCE